MSTETRSLVGDREKLRDAEERIRDGLIALADDLTDHDEYEIPWTAIRRLCPPDVPMSRLEGCFRGLLHAVVQRGPDRSRPLPFDAQVDLDYMTGARR
jgi:hypothetical protein